MAEKKTVEEITEEKKTGAAKPAVKKAAARKPAAKKTTTKKPAAKKTPEIIIQSALGGEITSAEIIDRIGKAEKIYVRVDENKAYWVNGEETGSIDLW